MLLTARSAEGDQYTRKQLTKVGINCDNLKIHYTNNMITKGEYIKSNIDISKYDEVICIDDYELYIMSILKVCPQIKCYLFFPIQEKIFLHLEYYLQHHLMIGVTLS